MEVEYKYDRSRDIRCLLTKGKGSYNSSHATKAYEQLVAFKGEEPTENDTDEFIEKYLLDNSIDTETWSQKYQKEWSEVSTEYQKRAEAIFGVTLPANVTGFLTINERCPYMIKDNFFYISVPTASANRIALHELWHFYTWYGLGEKEQDRLGKEKYNEFKESLTVLLNIECADLLGEGVVDAGYPQHQEIRSEITDFWMKSKDIKALWNHLAGT
jgi:hypothetical protein